MRSLLYTTPFTRREAARGYADSPTDKFRISPTSSWTGNRKNTFASLPPARKTQGRNGFRSYGKLRRPPFSMPSTDLVCGARLRLWALAKLRFIANYANTRLKLRSKAQPPQSPKIIPREWSTIKPSDWNWAAEE